MSRSNKETKGKPEGYGGKLGWGLLEKARKSMKGRTKKLDKEINRQVTGKPKNKEKKKKK